MERNTLFGEKIVYCRGFLGFSKKKLADILSVSPRALSKYEKGTALPSVKVLYTLSQLVDMPMEAFVADYYTLESFKEMSEKTTTEMFIEIHNKIVKELYKEK